MAFAWYRPISAWQQHTPVRAVAFSRDGTKVLSADEGSLTLTDLSVYKTIWSVPADADFIVFTPEDNVAVTAGMDGLVQSWDILNGTAKSTSNNSINTRILTKTYMFGEEQTFEDTQRHSAKSAINSVEFDFAGKAEIRSYMASHISSGTPSKSEDSQNVTLFSELSYSDSIARWELKCFAEHTSSNDKRVEMSIATYTMTASDAGVTAVVRSVPEIGMLSAVALSGQKPVWTVAIDSLNAVALSQDGRLVLTGSRQSSGDPDTLKLWDTTTGALLGSWPLRWTVTAIAFSPGGKTALVGLTETAEYRKSDKRLPVAGKSNLLLMTTTPPLPRRYQHFLWMSLTVFWVFGLAAFIKEMRKP